MEDQRRKALFRAIRRIVRPLALFLLRNSITYRDFAELSKEVWVDAAVREFGLRGRPTNTSRVALMTGLTRKEVKRIRDLLRSYREPVDPFYSRPLRLVDSWRQDAEYQDEKGSPRPIPFDGSDVSFVTLARRIGGDVPPVALLNELLRGKSVEQLADGNIKLVETTYLPTEESIESIHLAGDSIGDLIETVAFNLDPHRTTKPKLQRRVFSHLLPNPIAAAFQELASRRAQSLLTELDEWLQSRQLPVASAHETGDTIAAGLGIYYYERPSDPNDGELVETEDGSESFVANARRPRADAQKG